MRKMRPDVPAELERMVSQGLEKNWRARYPSASEMAAELEAWQASLTMASTRALNLRDIWQMSRRLRVAAPEAA